MNVFLANCVDSCTVPYPLYGNIFAFMHYKPPQGLIIKIVQYMSRG